MIAEPESERLRAAAGSLSALDFTDVAAAFVLGSGLKGFAEVLEDVVEVPFHQVANWPVPRVDGHGGSLLLGRIGGTRIACLTGRVHLYEGWHPGDVVRPVRTLRHLGVPSFVLTNAAGGLQPGMAAGDLMLLSDHLNLTGSSPLCGPHDPILGPRFPDQSAVYDPVHRDHLAKLHPAFKVGVYAGLLGPSYETPAEVRMLRGSGADAVGMSTVHEAMALSAMGARVVGISMISNLAAGLSPDPLDHEEVIQAGVAAAPVFRTVLLSFCETLSRPSP